ncbi:MAG: helix-turn-helix domain-containing protein [Egibacteraceae bacterium]
MTEIAEWDGSAARALRKALRMTQESFAKHLGASVRTVRVWEASGPAITPAMVYQEALDTALKQTTPEQRLRFSALLADEQRPDARWMAGAEEEEDTNRRGFVARFAAAVITAGLVPGDTVERLAAPMGGRVDSSLVSSHEDLADKLATAHRIVRPDILITPVSKHADELLTLLEQPMSSPDRAKLYELTTAVCAYAGTLAFGLTDRVRARRYFSLARDVADDRDNDILHAQALGASSAMHSPLPQGGRGGNPERATAMLSEAVDHADRADAHTRSWLNRWLALELAAAGDERGFRFHMHRVEQAFAEPIEDGKGYFGRAHDGSFGIDDERLYADTGLGLMLLGKADAAANLLARALTPKATRWGVFHSTILTDTAAARVLQREPEAACATLCHALDMTLAAGCPVGVERIRGVRARFPSMWTSLWYVRDLDERLPPGKLA